MHDMSSTGPGCSDRADALALLVGGDLDARAAAVLRLHVDGCAGCAAALCELEAARRWLEAWAAQPALPPELFATLERNLAAGLSEREAEIARRSWLGRVLGARWEAWRAGAGQRPARPALLGAAFAGAMALFVVATEDPSPSGGEPGVGPRAASSRSGALDLSPPLEPGRVGVSGAEAEDAEASAAETQGLRIELATRDPNIRIIWFASAKDARLDPSRGGL